MPKLKDKIKLQGKMRISSYKEGKLTYQSDWFPNLIVINDGNGLNLIMRGLLNGDTIKITHGKIGTNDDATTDADTDLNAPVVGLNVQIANTTEEAVGEGLWEFFITDSELPEDDYEEFGMFIGSAMFCRATFPATYTKSVGSDTKVEYSISVQNTSE